MKNDYTQSDFDRAWEDLKEQWPTLKAQTPSFAPPSFSKLRRRQRFGKLRRLFEVLLLLYGVYVVVVQFCHMPLFASQGLLAFVYWANLALTLAALYVCAVWVYWHNMCRDLLVPTDLYVYRLNRQQAANRRLLVTSLLLAPLLSFTVAVTDTWVVESTNLLAPSILAARWDELVVDILVPTAVCYLILIGSYRHDKRRIAALKEERIKSNTPIV